MKIAVPQWQNRVSPVLDEAGTFTVMEISEEGKQKRLEISLSSIDLPERMTFLYRFGVDGVICGAVSQSLKNILDSLHIEVISHICGEIDDILDAFVRGKLEESEYFQPGWTKAKERIEK